MTTEVRVNGTNNQETLKEAKAQIKNLSPMPLHFQNKARKINSKDKLSIDTITKEILKNIVSLTPTIKKFTNSNFGESNKVPSDQELTKNTSKLISDGLTQSIPATFSIETLLISIGMLLLLIFNKLSTTVLVDTAQLWSESLSICKETNWKSTPQQTLFMDTNGPSLIQLGLPEDSLLKSPTNLFVQPLLSKLPVNPLEEPTKSNSKTNTLLVKD